MLKTLFLFLFTGFSLITANANNDDMTKQKDPYQLRLFASPIRFTKIEKEKNFNYGIEVQKSDTRYDLEALYSRELYEYTDPLTQFSTKTDTHEGFISKAYSQHSMISLFWQGEYERKVENKIPLTKHKIRLGPLGAKVRIYEGKFLKEINLAIIPVYEYLEEVAISLDVDELFVYTPTSSKGIRPSFQLDILIDLNFLSFSNNLFYRPLYDLDSKKFEFDDNDLANLFTIKMSISENFSISFQQEFSWDKRRKEVHRLPRTDMSYEFYFEYTNSFTI